VADAGSRVIPGGCPLTRFQMLASFDLLTQRGGSGGYSSIFDLGKLGFVDWSGCKPSVSGSIPLMMIFQLPVSQSGWYGAEPVALSL